MYVHLCSIIHTQAHVLTAECNIHVHVYTVECNIHVHVHVHAIVFIVFVC